MSIKPQTGRRNYAKGGAVKRYAEGGTVWPDVSSPYAEGLPISGGSANLPGGTVQTGGPGVYDLDHPERGAQGASTFYQPAVGASTYYSDAADKASQGSVGASTYYSAAVDKALREKNRREQGG